MLQTQMLRRPDLMVFDGFVPSLSLTLLMAVWTFVPLGLMALCVGFTMTPFGQRVAVSSVRRIVLDEKSCYGTCPGFRLAFDADGTIQYVGTLEVALRGTYTTSIPVWYLKRIAEALERHGFFAARSLRD